MGRLAGITVFATTVLVAACGGQEIHGQAEFFNEIRGAGKADGYVDKSISCQGFCGGLATNDTGFCGCDDLCASYGDCCDDKATKCDGAGVDTTVITQADDGKTAVIDIGDTIDVQLAGNPTTGYQWHLLGNNRSFPLQKEEYVPSEPQLAGSGGTYHFYFTADVFAVGNKIELRFAYYRSWEGVKNAADTFTVTVNIAPEKTKCTQIDGDYQQEVAKAQGCAADVDCQTFVGGNLTCGIPHRAINTSLKDPVDALKKQWNMNKCWQVDWNCPLMQPLPPWMGTRGVCEQGTCKVEYFDTRAKEGQACGDDINVQCGEGLYCAFGLNWCGTPPVTGVCRTMGSCGAVSDCSNPKNHWNHPMCLGKATCNNNSCGWDCSM